MPYSAYKGRPSLNKTQVIRAPKSKPVAYSRASRRSNIMRIPPELKFFDTAVSFDFDSTLEVPATGQWALIPQGDTQSTRDGRLAVIKSIQFRGTVSGANLGAGTGIYL